jgi:hypothetical protein
MWLRVDPEGAEVKLLWGNDNGPHKAYFVGKGTFDYYCQQVRDDLAALVEIEIDQRDGVRAEALRKLARSGADLHYLLFEDVSIKDAAAIVRADMNARYRARTARYPDGDKRLRIIVHPSIHVPWALVYDGNADAIGEMADRLEDFGAFWGQKYSLSSTSTGYQQLPCDLERKLDASKLLSLMHKDAALAAYRGFSDKLRSDYEVLMAYPVGVANNKIDCEKLIAKAVPNDTIFHFFGHQNNGVLDLGGAQTIDVNQFKKLLDRLASQQGESQPYSLVLLNACETADGQMDHSFTNAADRPGICGAISTEAVVPRDYAAKFAISFLTQLLCKGRSVGESMSTLRHDEALWPLSLVYGCYAEPDYRISA